MTATNPIGQLRGIRAKMGPTQGSGLTPMKILAGAGWFKFPSVMPDVGGGSCRQTAKPNDLTALTNSSTNSLSDPEMFIPVWIPPSAAIDINPSMNGNLSSCNLLANCSPSVPDSTSSAYDRSITGFACLRMITIVLSIWSDCNRLGAISFSNARFALRSCSASFPDVRPVR